VLTSGAAFTRIVGNRFEGPAAAGIDIQGPATAVELRDNRIWRCDAGVLLSGKLAADRPFDVTLAHNTVVAATAGVDCGHPLTGRMQQLTLEKNYFGGVKAVIAGLAARPAGLKTAGNARDAVSPEGPVSSDAAVIAPDPLKPPDPKDDATFLRSPALTAHGAQKE